MKRIYHHHKKWEEVKAGMWRQISQREREFYRDKAAKLMRDVGGFTTAMRRALHEWPLSCEHHLSDISINRLAWLGHAGCCVALGSPEDATRLGWWQLDENEQRQANVAADMVVKEWEEMQCRNDQLELMF